MLNVLFLCGCLEPGKDGVGDYTRRLSAELKRRNIRVYIIALYDQYSSKTEVVVQKIEDTELEVTRIPMVLSDKKRFEIARHYINTASPDWISLQFVPFSFQVKGIPVKLSYQLKKIVGSTKIHIMFHELWVGMDKKAPLKYYLWRNIQKYLIKSMLVNLNPSLIHTHAQVYIKELLKLGFTAKKLPLISNIPVFKEINPVANQNQIPHEDKSTIEFIIFGSIHSGAPVQDFVDEVSSFCKKQKKSVTLKLIGKCGFKQVDWVKAFGEKNLKVHILGEQPSSKISNELKFASIGITTTPLFLTEKSGTVAAMLSHGLPVICVAKPWVPRSNFQLDTPMGVNEYKKGNFKDIVKETNISFEHSLEKIAKKFIGDLT